ncbi:MAG: hypothetical protein COA78_20165 [Blastopirellula sp.]|nr:MAG: hypothetical protein COA78_20165 [Blastopirellula sp.]
MPCNNGTRKEIEERKNATVKCEISSIDTDPITIEIIAREFQPIINKAGNVGGKHHANYHEMEAQKALVKHCVVYGVDIELYDDHWGRTGYALIEEFEKGNAWIRNGEHKIYFKELIKEEWKEGNHFLAMQGGILYKDSSGNIIFKKLTWLS